MKRVPIWKGRGAMKKNIEYLLHRMVAGTLPDSLPELEKLILELVVDSSMIEHFVNFSESSYCRTRILLMPQAELLCLGWMPGQRSPIHDHEGSLCCLLVLQGEAVEQRFEKIGTGETVRRTSLSILKPGMVSTAADSEIHHIENQAPWPLVTLHLYTPPLNMNTYTQNPKNENGHRI